jgi:hypothetical protein
MGDLRLQDQKRRPAKLARPDGGRVNFTTGGAEVKMICRIWHGWTNPAKADEYETLLRTEIFTGITRRNIPGLHGIDLLRRTVGNEVEFVTIMTFGSMAAVRAFAGENYEAAVVPPKAQALLSRFDARSAHYQVVV